MFYICNHIITTPSACDDYATGVTTNDDTVDWSPICEAWGFPDILYIWHGGLHADLVAQGLRNLDYQIRGQIIWAKKSPVISRGQYHWQHDDTYSRMRNGGDWVVCHVPLLSKGEAVVANVWYPEGYEGERLGTTVSGEVGLTGNVTSGEGDNGRSLSINH